MKLFIKVGAPRAPTNRDAYEVPIWLVAESVYHNEYGEQELNYKQMACTTLLIGDSALDKAGTDLKKVEKLIEKALPGAIEDFKKNVSEAVLAAKPFPKS